MTEMLHVQVVRLTLLLRVCYQFWFCFMTCWMITRMAFKLVILNNSFMGSIPAVYAVRPPKHRLWELFPPAAQASPFNFHQFSASFLFYCSYWLSLLRDELASLPLVWTDRIKSNLALGFTAERPLLWVYCIPQEPQTLRRISDPAARFCLGCVCVCVWDSINSRCCLDGAHGQVFQTAPPQLGTIQPLIERNSDNCLYAILMSSITFRS